MDITILHEGPNKGKPPHNAYGELDAAGVKVIWCDSLDDSAACIGKLGGAKFSAVVDNWSKSPEQIKPYAELAQSMDVTNYCYISSAGMYKPESDAIVTEDCACKTTGGLSPRLLPLRCAAPLAPRGGLHDAPCPPPTFATCHTRPHHPLAPPARTSRAQASGKPSYCSPR